MKFGPKHQRSMLDAIIRERGRASKREREGEGEGRGERERERGELPLEQCEVSSECVGHLTYLRTP